MKDELMLGPEPEPVEHEVKLGDIENMGCWLLARGTVDGEGVAAPFVAMVEGGKPAWEGGLKDLLVREWEERRKPQPEPEEKPVEPGPVEPGSVEPEPVDAAKLQEARAAKGKWDAWMRERYGRL